MTTDPRQLAEDVLAQTHLGDGAEVVMNLARELLSALDRSDAAEARAAAYEQALRQADEDLRQLKITGETATVNEHPSVLPNKIAARTHVARWQIAEALAAAEETKR